MRLYSLLFIAAAAAGQSSEDARKSQLARKAMEGGRFQEAIVLYTELVRALPDNPGLHLNLGLALHSSGNYPEALKQFGTAVKLEPGLTPAWLLMGLAHLKLNQPAAALDPLNQVLRADPENRVALLESGDALLSLGRGEEAAARFGKLAGFEPTNPKALQGLGLSHLAASRHAFERLEKSAPNSPYCLVLLGRSQMEQAQYRSAFRLYKQALAAMPELPGAHAALAEIYRKTGQPGWAEVEEARERQLPPIKRAAAAPGSPAFYYEVSMRHSIEALAAFEKLSSLPPTAELHELLGIAARVRRQHRESARHFQEALRLAPGNPRLETELARSLWLNRDYETALPLLERLLKAQPDSAELNFELGDSVLRLRSAEEAIPLLEVAVRRDRTNLQAHAALGQAYLRVGKAPLAIEELRAALPVDEDGRMRYQLAQAYRETGQTGEADRMLREFERVRERAKPAEEGEITPP
jgi:tetratricopeptide (TPR) repeat protein